MRAGLVSTNGDLAVKNNLNPPLVVRHGRILVVVIVARISTDKQDPRSLEDQIAKCREYLAENFDGEIKFIIIQSQGSGEHLDRQELVDLEDHIESRQVDVVIVEDLSRICRRRRAYDFCEMCEDFDTRLIAINDRVDTAVEGWQDAAFFSTWHHERSNRDTANRIRRSLNNRFDNGGVIQFTIYGHIKPPGAKHDSELQKDPAAEPIIREIFRRLEFGADYTEVADWLNEINVHPGPYCDREEWNGPMVSRFVHHPILKGVRIRNRKISRRVNKSGHHKSVKGDPKFWRYRNVPHLAYFEPAYYDHVISLLDARNPQCRRTANGQPDPRLHVPRKRTAFPGQHARCGICGRLLYWHASKKRPYLLCKGAAEWQCWNSVYVYGAHASQKIIAAVLDGVMQMPEFDTVFGDLVRNQAGELDGQRTQRREGLERELREINNSMTNLTRALETGRKLQVVVNRLSELEQQQSEMQYQLHCLESASPPEIALPEAEELRRRAVTALTALAADDQETGRLLRQLLPDLHIHPYQVIDGSDIVPRAEFTLTLVSLLPPELQMKPEAQVFTRPMVVTLSEVSKFVEHHQDAADLHLQGLKQRQIGARLGLFQSTVERALRVHRKMMEMGLTEPFVRLTELPSETNRLRRHRHPRFRFKPLDGYPR